MDCTKLNNLELIQMLKCIKLDADIRKPTEERINFEKLKKENPNAIEENFEYKIINKTLLIDNYESRLYFLSHKMEIPDEIEVCLMHSRKQFFV
jgi:hypothetical protein